MEVERLLIARNELENKVNDLRQGLQLSEAEMMLVVEMVLSTTRYQASVRSVYNKVKIVNVNKESENGNTNEKGQ